MKEEEKHTIIPLKARKKYTTKEGAFAYLELQQHQVKWIK